MNREEFLTQVREYREAAHKIASKRAYINPNSYPSHGPAFTPDGVVFYDLVPRQYESGEEIVDVLVTWAEVENLEETLKDIDRAVARQKREQAMRAEEWRRKQYEALKAEFEK